MQLFVALPARLRRRSAHRDGRSRVTSVARRLAHPGAARRARYTADAGRYRLRAAIAGVIWVVFAVAVASGCATWQEPASPERAGPPDASASIPEPLTLPLWPNPSGARGRVLERPADPVRGAIQRITDVTEPTLTLYRPTATDTATAAVLVFPGGGYQYLAVDIEGTEICRWLTNAGVACALVTYRVPQPPDSTRHLQPLQDAQRAIGLVRLHARSWGINPHRVGVLGFSAGAHLAAALSAHPDGRTYAPVDAADAEHSRPDFALLLYPAYLTYTGENGGLSTEVRPTPGMPPTFLVQTVDDPIGVENSLHYARALREAGVPVELHLYPEGGHGYGLRPAVGEVARAWPGLALRWLSTIKMLPEKAAPDLP